ncbi:hypothetical protein [Nocardia mexicana]|uniref:Uncharacterized protein n=1 Tax=Nocardia mexicana TaxID=279262 RepID=A0A370H9Q8_9NOCA|nr:hypothetical protein [Nocardia mexicana]RDI51041.1 hypothetical protein DFR68_105518 [Nocardia mexicana]
MTVRSNTTPIDPRDDLETSDDAVVWPEPSPLSSWWQKVMQPPADRRSAPQKS